MNESRYSARYEERALGCGTGPVVSESEREMRRAREYGVKVNVAHVSVISVRGQFPSRIRCKPRANDRGESGKLGAAARETEWKPEFVAKGTPPHEETTHDGDVRTHARTNGRSVCLSSWVFVHGHPQPFRTRPLRSRRVVALKCPFYDSAATAVSCAINCAARAHSGPRFSA